MDKHDYKKEFCARLAIFNYKYSKWQVWTDFLYLSAAAMANVAPVPEREQRERQYLSIIKRYSKEEQIAFTEMLAIVVMALDENPEQDFLGELYHHLNLQQHQKGQFFTPYHVCEMMSEVVHGGDDISGEVKEKGYVSVSDPACGAGAMLIAFANVVRKQGVNYQKQVLFIAQDIDMTAALMCYIQLSILGCSAIVIVGDSLLKPGFHKDNDIWCTPMYYLNQWRFKEDAA